MSDTLLNLFSYDSGTDSCFLEELEEERWRRFAARVFARSLDSSNLDAPRVVSMALAMEAGERGWTELFERWAAKAHEIGEVVPESICGAKDAVDENGDIEPQSVFLKMLVPLLTAALQESITKIEALETRVATLEAA